jgi:hypothetical protein
VKVTTHYEDAEGAWPVKRSRESITPDGNLREAAVKQGAVIVEPKQPGKEGEE